MPRFHDGDASQDAKRKRRSARGTAVGEGEWLDVVERVGRWVRVRNAKGELRVLPTRGAHVVVADRVRLTDDVVVETAPRDTSLERTGETAGTRMVVSNVEQLVIVTASTDPPFRPGLIDRMIVAAIAGGMAPMIALNKCDTGMEDSVLEWLARYEALGYPVFLVSAVDGRGVPELRAALIGRSSVLLGHSGVGKSTLVSALVPGAVALVGDLDAWGRGRHTTTAARAYDLPEGGAIVDVPGIREFGVGHIPRAELRTYFPELVGLECRYRDCLHLGEEGCVADDAISWKERLESYRKLIEDCI
jgi:ribosome biogenesis GTPase / thiamine phosphate phosphatase